MEYSTFCFFPFIVSFAQQGSAVRLYVLSFIVFFLVLLTALVARSESSDHSEERDARACDGAVCRVSESTAAAIERRCGNRSAAAANVRVDDLVSN